MRLLLTGFEPFLDYEVNPTMPIVEALNGTQIGEYDIIGRILPVSFKEAQQAFVELIEDIEPDSIISLGVAVGRFHITPERVAINMRDSNEPDNDGNAPQGEAFGFPTKGLSNPNPRRQVGLLLCVKRRHVSIER